MADTDSLTPDQLDKVMQFQEVSGCTDVCVCVAALATANWEVELAVHQHLTQASSGGDSRVDEGGSSTTTTTTSTATTTTISSSDQQSVVRRRVSENVVSSESSSSSSQVTGGVTSSSTPRVVSGGTTGPPSAALPPQHPRPLHTSPPGALRRISAWAVYLGFTLPSKLFIHWPVRLCYWTVQSLFAVAYSLLYSTSAAADPMRDLDQFLQTYSSNYPGLAHPTFYRGSYSQALNLAKQKLQFLLVYLHCGHHLNTDTFCRRVLSDAEVRNYISSNNILFWACDVTLPEGYRVSQALRENDYPYLALMVLRNNRMSVVARMEGTTLLEPRYVVDTLTRHYNSSMPYITAARLSRLEREQAVALRQEQDTAYQMSLRVDREKARRKVEADEQVRQKEALERQQELEEQQRRMKMKEMIPQEPDANTPGALQLVVKLPGGERIARSFHVDHPLSGLYCLLYTHPDAPDRFEVTTNFPRRVLPCNPPLCLRQNNKKQQQDSSGNNNSEQQQQSSATSSEQQQEEEEKVEEGEVEPTFGSFGIAPRTVLFVKDLDA
uniref:FAS-associated factor 2 n=1 Tax=Hirondellea gigas TaxID=1518452 RepID=A0A6A7FY38_9CRUS